MRRGHLQFHLEVLPTAERAADAAARRFVLVADNAIRARGECVVALSGGSTPQGMYRKLAGESWASSLDWSRIQVLWGDERCVRPDHEASNYRMAREALLDHVPIPPVNVHRIHGEDDPAGAAAAYERVLRHMLRTPSGPPRATPGRRIDLVLLGLGEDGHTASIFPGSIAVHEDPRWVRPAEPAGASTQRVTLTPLLINAAAEVAFLVVGTAKAAIVRHVLEGPRRPNEWPAQLIAPVAGQLRWFIDSDAAARLPDSSDGLTTG